MKRMAETAYKAIPDNSFQLKSQLVTLADTEADPNLNKSCPIAPPGRCAGFPAQPPQTPPCGFPAMGSSSMTPRTGAWSRDPGKRQRMASQELFILRPWKGLASCPAVQPLPPSTPHRPIEPPYSRVVRRPPVVLVMPQKLAVERLTLFVDRVVPMLPTPFGDS